MAARGLNADHWDLYCQLWQLLMILLAVVARQVYYEIYRLKLRNVQVFHAGDQFAIGLAVGLVIWAGLEWLMIAQFGQAGPTVWLRQSLQIALWVCGLLPIGLWLLQAGLKLRLGDWLTGVGRGCLSFGLPIASCAALCWFPH
jgi:hypothetical protein